LIRGLYGAGGCGRGIMPLLRAQLSGAAADLVFIDDRLAGAEVNGHRVLSFAQFAGHPDPDRALAIAIADPAVRQGIAAQCTAARLAFVTVRAAGVVTMDDVVVGEGALLSPGVVLTSNIRIGRHFHANLSSYVEHDCVIGDLVTFAPGVMCNGNVHIGDGAYIGAGAVIRQGSTEAPLTIGAGAVVGMGAVVLKSVPPGATVVGNPARKLK
jgi:sugar O-acyltransferase (sialic acid O-acetyltransferase NeuD family)